jgi:GrpB-like predicted nucleotidyltransferase (UPF0157 family)
VEVKIVPYRAEWPDEFQKIAKSLCEALGDYALRIDHIGSTSGPGLSAKDIIDIQVTVESLDPSIKKALTGLGYQRVERITHDHIPTGGPFELDEWAKWFFRPPAGQRPTNLHVRISGHANQAYPILFRDFLRENPATAEAYARVKMELAKYHPDDIEAYVTIKDPVCDIIMEAAKRMAKEKGWKMGTSDG